jgi:hypothetical protein
MFHSCCCCLESFPIGDLAECLECGSSFCDMTPGCLGECLCELKLRLGSMTREEMELRLRLLSSRIKEPAIAA